MLNSQLSKKLQQPVNFKFQLLDFANLGYIFNYDKLKIYILDNYSLISI
jgi:hypothetical protein